MIRNHGKKFDKFLKYIEKVEMESNRKTCNTLIELTCHYYSLVCQYNNLERVRHKLANIYSWKDGEIKLKEYQLDIINRLFLEFFLKFSCVTINAKNNFITVSDEKEKVEDLEEDYTLSELFINDNSLHDKILESCKNATEIYRDKQRFELGLDNIRKAVRLYKRYENMKLKSAEESFNAKWV